MTRKVKALLGTTGALLIAAAVVIPVILTQVVNKTASSAAAPAGPGEEQKAADVFYATPLSQLPLPAARTGYAAPVLDESATTYTPASPVGTAGLRAVFRYEPLAAGGKTVIVRYTTNVVRGPDQIEDLSDQPNLDYVVTYKTEKNAIVLPSERDGYAPPVPHPGRTTYTEQTAAGVRSRVAFAFRPLDQNRPLLVVVYGAVVRRGEALARDGGTVELRHGTPLDDLPVPPLVAGYGAPVLDRDATTYAPDSPVGAMGLALAWTYSPVDPSEGDLLVSQAVTVTRATANRTAISKTVAFGTPPESVGRPATAAGYGTPALDASRTDYTATSAPGTAGLRVVWTMTSADPDKPDREVVINVRIVPAPTVETAAARLDVQAGTAPSRVAALSARAGYQRPVLDEASTYSATTSAGEDAQLTYLYGSNDPDGADLLFIQPLTVYELSSTALRIAYQTEQASISAPAQRAGYRPPVLDERTSYRATTPVGAEGVYVWFRHDSLTPNALPLLVKYEAVVTRQTDTSASGAELRLAYGTPLARLSKPSDRTGYAQAVLDTTRTTYAPDSAAGTQNLRVVWRFEPVDAARGTVYVEQAVVVEKAADKGETATATVAYGTMPDSVGVPASRAGYGSPALQTETTYLAASPAGATGLVVVWRLANDNSSAADVVVTVSVTVTKQTDEVENLTEALELEVGTGLADIGRPADRTGYASPVVDETTTYASTMPVGASAVIVFRYANSDESAADTVVRRPVRVVAVREAYVGRLNFVLRERPDAVPAFAAARNIALPAWLSFTGRQQAYYAGTRQESAAFLTGLGEGDSFEVVHEVQNSAGAVSRRDSLTITYVLRLTKPDAFVLAPETRFPVEPLTLTEPDVPAGYALAETSYAVGLERFLLVVYPATLAQVQAGYGNGLLMITRKYVKEGAVPLYYYQEHVTAASSVPFKDAVGRTTFYVSFGHNLAVSRPRPWGGITWGDPTYRLVKAVQPNKSNYDPRYATLGMALTEADLAKLPATAIFSATFADAQQRNNFTVNYEVTKRSYKTSDLAFTDRFQYPAGTVPTSTALPEIDGFTSTLQKIRVDQQASVPGRFYTASPLAGAEELAAVPAGTTVALRYRLVPRNDNIVLEGDGYVSLFYTALDSPANSTQRRRVVWGTDPAQIGPLPESRSGYAPPVVDTDRTTYTAAHGAGQADLTVVYRYDSLTTGGRPAYASFPVSVTMRQASASDIFIVVKDRYFLGAKAPVEDEVRLNLPEGHLLTGEPVYHPYGETWPSFNGLYIATYFQVGQRFDAVYNTKLAPNYAGHSIKVTVTYLISERRGQNVFVAAPRAVGRNAPIYVAPQTDVPTHTYVYYGMAATGNSPEVFPDADHAEDTYASDPAVTSYWALVHEHYEHSKWYDNVDHYQFVYVDKTATNPALPADPAAYLQGALPIDYGASVTFVTDLITKQAIAGVTGTVTKTGGPDYVVGETLYPNYAPTLPAGSAYDVTIGAAAPGGVPFTTRFTVLPYNWDYGYDQINREGRLNPLPQHSLPPIRTNLKLVVTVQRASTGSAPGMFTTGAVIPYPALVTNAPVGTWFRFTYYVYGEDANYTRNAPLEEAELYEVTALR